MQKTAIANVEIRRDEDRLTVRQSVKARLNMLASFAFLLYMGWGGAYAGYRLHHAWMIPVFGLLALFSLLMVVMALAQGGKSCVLDRQSGFLSDGIKRLRPLSEITAVEVERSSGMYHVWFGFSSGPRARVLPLGSSFKLEAEAKHFAQELAGFLNLPISDRAAQEQHGS